jgi:hypothetical protein
MARVTYGESSTDQLRSIPGRITPQTKIEKFRDYTTMTPLFHVYYTDAI